MMDQRLAAMMIQTAICNAVLEDSEVAKEWLLINRDPNPSEIMNPPAASYISACMAVGIDWVGLRTQLREALIIQDSPPNLALVHSSGLCHNNSNAPDHDSYRTRTPTRRKPQLYLQAVPATKRSP